MNILPILFSPVILDFGGDTCQRPCNLNGGSPFLLIAKSRITGSLFTGREESTYTRFSLAPVEQTAYRWLFPHRVERSSPKITSKGNKAVSPPNLSKVPSLNLFFTHPLYHACLSFCLALKRTTALKRSPSAFKKSHSALKRSTHYA